MATKKTNIGRLGQAARAARGNRYVERLIEDRELRETLRGAYGAARSAYGRMNNGQAPTKALFEDRKLQHELAKAAGALRDVSSALRESPAHSRRRSPRSRHRVRRTMVVVVVGAGAALVISKDLRSKVLDLMFGSEEEFSYSSTTTPSEPAPAPSAPTPSS